MTTAVLERPTAAADLPKHPAWCTNPEGECAKAGGGDMWHTGTVGSVIVPASDYCYDEWIGVELFRYDLEDGTVNQLSVLIIYGIEGMEQDHVAIEIEDAREFADLLHTAYREPVPSATFLGGSGNALTVKRHRGRQAYLTWDVGAGAAKFEAKLNRTRLRSLAAIVSSACVLAEATK